MSSTLGNTNETDGGSYLNKSKKIKREREIDNYGTSKREGFGNNNDDEDERTEDDDGKRTNSNWGQFLKSLLVYLIMRIGIISSSTSLCTITPEFSDSAKLFCSSIAYPLT